VKRAQPFKRSAATEALVRYLAAFEMGTQLSYAELTNAAGEEITPRSGKLRSATHILMASHGQVWVLVPPQIGVRRLNDSEIAARFASLHMNGARHKLKHGTTLAEQVDARQLGKNEQVKFSVDCIQRELGLQALSKSARRDLERIARGSSNELPKFNILEWAVSLSAPRKP
jgi:hypothetical protein